MRLPRIAAGLGAFSPGFPLTQRHAVYLHILEADLGPIRRDWVGRSSLQVAGSRSSSRKHRPRDGHIVPALTSDMRHESKLIGRRVWLPIGSVWGEPSGACRTYTSAVHC